MTTGETHLYQFLVALVAAAGVGTPLASAEVHDTPHRKITGDKGLRVWDGESDLLPGPAGAIKDLDCDTMVVCFVRVPKDTPTDRLASRDLAVDMAAIVVAAIYADGSLGNRVCDTLVGRVPRNYVEVGTVVYAVANIHLLINPSGQRSA